MAPYSLHWIVTAGLIPWLVLVLAVLRLDVLPSWSPEPRLHAGAAAGAATGSDSTECTETSVDRNHRARHE